MILHLSPQRNDNSVVYALNGNTFFVNETAYDFEQLEEGDVLPLGSIDCNWIVSDVTRTDGQLVLTVLLPHGYTTDSSILFPAPIEVTEDGVITLPTTEIDNDN